MPKIYTHKPRYIVQKHNKKNGNTSFIENVNLANNKFGGKNRLTAFIIYGIVFRDELPKTAGTIYGVSIAPAEEEL